MIQMLVAVLMWALVASLLILRHRRSDRSITYAAITIATAMTLNMDPIYTAADGMLGGTNIVTLAADAVLMTGLFFLGRGIMRAGGYRPGLVRLAVSRPTLLVALAGITATFWLIDHDGTTTQFMLDLGAQPAAAAYSIIQFTYFAIVVTAMTALAARQLRHTTALHRLPAARQLRHTTALHRLPAALLLIGAASGVALCAVVIAMDIAHLAGQLALMTSLGTAYDLLSILAFLFLCAGLASQPAVRRIGERRRRAQTQRMVGQLEPTWRRATAARPGLSQAHPTAGSIDPETCLHREVVEIRDAMIDPRVTFHITRSDLALLVQAETHLLGAGASRRTDRTAHGGTEPGEHP